MNLTETIITVNTKPQPYTFMRINDGDMTWESSQFYRFDVDDNYYALFDSIGGMTAQLLYNSVKELDADRVTILTYIGTHMRFHTKVLIEKDGDVAVKVLRTTTKLYQRYVWNFIRQNQEQLKNLTIGNSGDYIQDEHFGEYLNDYYSPTKPNETGLFINDEPVNFHDTLVLKHYNRVLEKPFGVHTAKIQLADTVSGLFNIIGDVWYFKEDGSPISEFEQFVRTRDDLDGLTLAEALRKELRLSALDEVERYKRRIYRYTKRKIIDDWCRKKIAQQTEKLRDNLNDLMKMYLEMESTPIKDIITHESLGAVLNSDKIEVVDWTHSQPRSNKDTRAVEE